MGKKRSEDDIEAIVSDMGYGYISNRRNSKGDTLVSFFDEFGYKYEKRLDHIIELHTPRFVGKDNIYSLYNISLWLKLNKKKFILLEDNEYRGGSEKLNLYCKECKSNFSINWKNLQSGQGCGVCEGRQIVKNNNLLFLRKDLASEWNYYKNSINPEDVTINSGKYVYWICKICGYGSGSNGEWKTRVADRSSGSGCPACSIPSKVVTNENSLHTLYPKISSEWHPTKNGKLKPSDFSYGSQKKVHWFCSLCEYGKDGEWYSPITSRTSLNRGCPRCSSSVGEKRIREYLLKKEIPFYSEYKFDDCVNETRLPFDFYIPSMNICIEYDGIFHYKDIFKNPNNFKLGKKRDRIKNKYCKKNKIKLLRIPYWEFENIENILDKNLLNK